MATALMHRLSPHHSIRDNPHEQSAIRRFYERNIAPLGGDRYSRSHLTAVAGHAAIQSGESLAVGGALAAIHVHAKHGLDLADGKAPLDGILWLVGMAGGVAAAPYDGFTSDLLRNAGASGMSVLSFRKTFEFLAAKKHAAGAGAPGGVVAGGGAVGAKPAASGAAPATVAGEDHILKIAKAMNL